jgi:UDP-glucose 6-dehydrogenase
MREAASLVAIDNLLAAHARVQVHGSEPVEKAQRIFGGRVSHHRTNYEALSNANALMMLTRPAPQTPALSG